MKMYLMTFLFLIPAIAFADDAATIVQKGRRFSAPELTIRRGQSIVFTNEDEFIHQIYVDGLFDSEERTPGQLLREEFSKNGTFDVRCHIHPKMSLVVHVI